MHLPECQHSHVTVSSKEAPDRPHVRGDPCMWGHTFFSSGVAWTHAGRSVAQESRALCLEGQQPAFSVFLG